MDARCSKAFHVTSITTRLHRARRLRGDAARFRAGLCDLLDDARGRGVDHARIEAQSRARAHRGYGSGARRRARHSPGAHGRHIRRQPEGLARPALRARHHHVHDFPGKSARQPPLAWPMGRAEFIDNATEAPRSCHTAPLILLASTAGALAVLASAAQTGHSPAESVGLCAPKAASWSFDP
jgi:hypothetical protein